MAQPAQITIKIKCLKSDDFTVSIDSEASVDDLKEEIVRIKSIEPTRQRLIYKGRVLKSDKKLLDYKISDSTTIHLIIRKQPVTNPRNDEPNESNRVNTRNTNTSMPTGTTAISVAVVDAGNGTADVNSILNSVLSGFSSGNLNQQSLQNQIQSAMNNNPAHVMNLRGLLNPGDNPNAPNDDDVSSIDGDNENDNNTGQRGILNDLQPQFAVSNGRGGYSPVTLLPPVLRSCNAINLELDRLQRNYNKDALGIDVGNDNDNDNGNDNNTADESNMSLDNSNIMNVDGNDIEVEVQTIIADSNGNVLTNNVAPINQNQTQTQNQNNNGNVNVNVTTNAQGTQAPAQGQAPPQAQPQPRVRGRREYLNNLLDTWERYNEVINGLDPMNNIMDEDGDNDTGNMDEDIDDANDNDNDNDEEMKGNELNENINKYSGVIGYIETVFDELIDFQNTIESGLNNQIMEKEKKDEQESKNNKEEKKCDEDNDMEMKGNNNNENTNNINNTNELKGYSKSDKDVLKKRAKSAGNMLIEIGTILASLGHMIDKMDIYRNTTRNRLRITGLSGISHVVRTAVPVEISTIVSRGINMGNLPQFQQIRQIRQQMQQQNNTQPQPQPQSQPQPAANTNQNVQPQPQPPPQPQPQPVNNNATTTSTTVSNGNTSTNSNSNLLSAVLDEFGNNNQNNDANSMEVDDNNTTAPTTVPVPAPAAPAPANPLASLMSALGGGGSGGSNPLASLMSAFGSASNRNISNPNSSNSNNSSNDRNPLILINRTIKFLIDNISISELNEIKKGKYLFLRNYHQLLKSFILNTIMNKQCDTPMVRHEIAMDYASGFGLFMIYTKFSNERREVIRSLTTNHFRNHITLLFDIILDSKSDIIFENKFIEWIQTVFSSWIYKLSLKFQNRIKGVKILFGTILMNVTKYLYSNNNNILNKTQLIPSFVEYFVDEGKSYHLKTMAQVHNDMNNNNNNNVNRNDINNNKIKRKKIYGNEQWVMNVEESERNRWVDTIKCDQKRIKESLNQIKGHKFSESYLIPSHQNKNINKNDEKKNNKK